MEKVIGGKAEYARGNTYFKRRGGGMMCPTKLHYRMAARLVKNTGARLYFPFYPLGPEASIEETLAWVYDFYELLLKKHSSKSITIIGDSAGAALAAALCAHTDAQPAGLVLISPPVGIEKCSDKMRSLEKIDLMLSVKATEIIKKHWLKNASFDGADFNTLETDYSRFAPILMYYGTNEIFYAHIDELIDKIKAGGAAFEVHEGRGLCHDWVLIGIIPESREATERICRFIKNADI
ncbi:MAG: alpha/beta hydrolase [Clostridiales bacterium]|nr:alpha/beta hydrolase [Clostridiales bacterium]